MLEYLERVRGETSGGLDIGEKSMCRHLVVFEYLVRVRGETSGGLDCL